MKIKLLTTLIAGALLTGCGSDNDNSVTPEIKAKQVQAYDGAVNGMIASFSCTDGATGKTEESTDGYGKATIKHNTFADSPETCELEFKAGAKGAIDMSNGKDMSNVVYSIPKGLLTANEAVAATPFTTLVAKTIKETGDTDITTAVNSVFTSLGLDSELTEAQKRGLLTDPDATLKTLDSSVSQAVIATTMVLSDAITAQPNKPVANIAKVTETVAQDLVDKNPEFPTQTGSDKPIYVDLTTELAKDSVFEEATTGTVPPSIEESTTKPSVGEEQDPTAPPIKPEKPEPPTGGTGGSEGDNSGGTGA
ncbi:hypothetical protein ACRTC3_20290 [Photobacterium damselae]|uniref:hypothetical protein n=1 Tax=Photobacterium damselae TaxID=38293 RepID=UPI003D7D239C